MAYLTSFNYGKLCKELQLKDNFKITLEVFLEHIFNDKAFFYIFNKLELEYLFKYRKLLADTDEFVLKYYKDIPNKEDNKVWVFNKGGRTKYHLSLNCENLTNDFVDFVIPSDIRKNGNDAIDEYRNWFSSQGFAQKFKEQKINKQDIVEAFNSKYTKLGYSSIQDNSNLLVLELKNSGTEYVKQQQDVDMLILELNELLLLYRNAFPGPGDRIIAKHNYLRNKSDEEITKKMKEIFNGNFSGEKDKLEDLRKRFKQAHEITFNITQKLINYFKWTYNLNGKSFDPTTLENFGLVCCKSCSSLQNLVSFKDL